jgi:SAM-dependent methyltransferase
MPEFTGERVIPGLVEQDLWNEHIARYHFAALHAAAKKVLDIGCGAGYGAAELAQVASSVDAADLSQDAIEYARAHYPLANLRFHIAPAGALSFPSHSFDLITAFELIEHLEDWPALLEEARRLLRPEGVFLVSTPNREYYADTRSRVGPNPFHAHEFDYREFDAALRARFACVEILSQNRVESFAFHPYKRTLPAAARIEGGGGAREDAHFFLAVCSQTPVPVESFVYVPRAANLLREREQHVASLERQLADLQEQHLRLAQAHEAQGRELQDHNRWALELETLWKQSQNRVAELQDAFHAEQQQALAMASRYDAKISELEADIRAKTAWALETERRLTAELQAKCDELFQAVQLLTRAEATVEERTRWAEQLQAQLQHCEARLNLIRASRWLKLGRAVGLGPKVDGGR